MNKQEKVVYALSGVAFAVIFLLVFGSYLVADEQRMATIAIEDVPFNAIEDTAVKNQPIYWKGNVYEPEKLKSIEVPNTDYFKINPMDSIKFSVGYRYNRIAPTVFVRGIKYNDLPFVYDYERGINLGPADDVVFIQYVSGFRQYELKEFKISKSPPWIIDIRYQKIGLLDGILMSIFLGFFAGYATCFIVMIIAIIIMMALLPKSPLKFIFGYNKPFFKNR